MITRDLLQDVLGSSVNPRDINVYMEAFIHKSAFKNFRMSQERLEHLGDAVLSLCVCHMLFERYPHEPEGVLTKMRTRLVNGKTLSIIGRAMGIERAIIIDPAALNALENDRLFEDTFEAVIGAVYLDQGLDTAKHFVATQYDKYVDPEVMTQDTNFKDIIKKATIKRGLQAPRYTCENKDGVFFCKVTIGDSVFGESQANTKKESEMEAAKNAIYIHFPEFSSIRIT